MLLKFIILKKEKPDFNEIDERLAIKTNIARINKNKFSRTGILFVIFLFYLYS